MSEVRLEQMYIVCDRRALGFYFYAFLGCLQHLFQSVGERCRSVFRSLMLVWHISQGALLELQQSWGFIHVTVVHSWAVITLKLLSDFPEWEEGRDMEKPIFHQIKR